MGWASRYGKWQEDFASSRHTPVRFKYIFAGLLGFIVLIACVAFFPLTLALVPNRQLTEYMPKDVYCATCKEIWNHNRDLFNREDMLCYGPYTHDRPTKKEEEVMYSEETRCWALKYGHDQWMRPLRVTAEETEMWNEGRKKRRIS